MRVLGVEFSSEKFPPPLGRRRVAQTRWFPVITLTAAGSEAGQRRARCWARICYQGCQWQQPRPARDPWLLAGKCRHRWYRRPCRHMNRAPRRYRSHTGYPLAARLPTSRGSTKQSLRRRHRHRRSGRWERSEPRRGAGLVVAAAVVTVTGALVVESAPVVPFRL